MRFLIILLLLTGCVKEQTQPQDNLVEYFTLYEVDGVAQTGSLTLYFGPGFTFDHYSCSVPSIPSSGSWHTDQNILNLSDSTYQVNKNEKGQFWITSSKQYRFTFDGNNVQ